ncbi:hypothetical protein ACOMHN_038810 [Nucella lapillus]
MGNDMSREEASELKEDSDPLGLRDLAIVLKDEFNLVAEELDKHTRNVNITRVTGGVVAVSGGVTAIVGLALIPVTFGLSAIVAGAVGAGIAATGGLTAGGACVVKLVIEHVQKKKLLSKWSDFMQMLGRELQQQDPEAFQKLQNDLKKRVGEAAGTAGTVAAVIGTSAGAARVGVSAARGGATAVGGAAARVATGVAAGSIVLNVALLGISLYDIIDGSMKLYKKTGSPAGDYLRELARSLDEFGQTGLTEEFIMMAIL